MYFRFDEFKLRIKLTNTKVSMNEYRFNEENVKNFFNSNLSYMKSL